MIQDRHILEASGFSELRRTALDIVEAGLAACDPGEYVTGLVHADDSGLTIGQRRFTLGSGSRVLVVGAGKASFRIAQELERILGPRIDGGLIVVPRGQSGLLHHVDVMEADHPIPTPASLQAGLAVLDLARSVGSTDLVIACFTGGSSALVSVPPDEVPFDHKAELHRLLVYSGANIVEINAVRKHVSRLKGGRLAQAIAPATLVNLTVSDVAGDPLDAITDPTVRDSTTVADATAILHKYDLWNRLSNSIKRHLTSSPDAESAGLDDRSIHTFLLITGDLVCRAMSVAADRLGYTILGTHSKLDGDAKQLGRHVVKLARAANARSAGRPYVILGCGGESTVAIAGSINIGAGGPNQEAALASALAFQPGDRMAVAFVDTDGFDGGTNVAGGLVDHETVLRARKIGLDLRLALKYHTSSNVLRRLDSVIKTGPTGTNVNDLFVIACRGKP